MTTRTLTSPQAASGSTRLAAATAAIVIGLALIWAGGMAPAKALHDAAHDGRHTLALPCH